MRGVTTRTMTVFTLALLCWAGTSGADTLVIRGGTVHPVAGEPFVGNVVVEDGVVSAVGPDATAPNARTIDAAGKHVYPGMFDALSQLGLLEVGAVAATDDQAEMGTYNPHLQATTAIHPASEVIPVTRANGITHTVVAPQSDGDGVIAGRAALVNLDGWTVEEMAIDPAIALVVSWPAIQTRRFDFATFSIKETPFNEAKENAEKKQGELGDWIEAARHYSQAVDSGNGRAEKDLKLDALSQFLEGRAPVIVLANNKRDIEGAVEFAEEEGLKIILGGARDAWKVKEMLAEKEIPVILGLTQSLPREQDDPHDRPFRNPAELVEAGVKIAFSSGAGGGFGPGGPHNSRTTPYEAGHAIPYGLSEEDALKALTLWPAEILGVADRLGTIEPGKAANLIVTDGSPLDITTRIEHLIIAGREVSTSNKHRALYERYRSR